MQLADYETMARALATIGACDIDVDFTAFSRDLEAFFAELEQVNATVVVNSGDRVRSAAVVEVSGVVHVSFISGEIIRSSLSFYTFLLISS